MFFAWFFDLRRGSHSHLCEFRSFTCRGFLDCAIRFRWFLLDTSVKLIRFCCLSKGSIFWRLNDKLHERLKPKSFHNLLQSTLLSHSIRMFIQWLVACVLFWDWKRCGGDWGFGGSFLTCAVFAVPSGARRQVLNEVVECAVFAVPSGARRQVLNEVVERPRGRAPGRNGKVLQGLNTPTCRSISKKSLTSVS